MVAAGPGEKDYEDTQSWRLALFFFCFGLVSVGTEHVLHQLLHLVTEKQMLGVRDVINKLKDELMLLGFISLVLVLLQDRILAVCVPQCGAIWGSCSEDSGNATDDSRRMLAAAAPIECGEGEEQFISLTALHQIHIFIFVLAVSLIGTGSAAMLTALGRLRTWAKWEKEHAEFDALLDGDVNADAQCAAKWEVLERSHSRCLYQSLWIPLFGADKITFLYMRRFFIRKHKRSKTFGFAKYVTGCTEDEFAQTLDIDGQDWLLAMLSVALREYWFTVRPLPLVLSPCPWISTDRLCRCRVAALGFLSVSRPLCPLGSQALGYRADVWEGYTRHGHWPFGIGNPGRQRQGTSST
jgi:mlo protein